MEALRELKSKRNRETRGAGRERREREMVLNDAQNEIRCYYQVWRGRRLEMNRSDRDDAIAHAAEFPDGRVVEIQFKTGQTTFRRARDIKA